MSNHRASLLAGFLLALSSGCEKTAAPPPEVAAAPAETAAPAATTPVAAPEPSAAPVPADPAAPAAPAETAVPAAPSAAPSVAPSPGAAPSAAAAKGKPAAAASKTAPAPAPAETAAASGATPDDACKTKNFHYSQVASACKSGGRKSAKAVMKNAVAKAKAAGTDLKCTSCHEDMKEFHLKSNAVGDLKNWL